MQIKSKHFGSFSQCKHSVEIAHGHDYQITVLTHLQIQLCHFWANEILISFRNTMGISKKKKIEKPPLLPLLVCPKWSSGMNLADLYFILYYRPASVSKVLFPLFHFLLVPGIFFLGKCSYAVVSPFLGSGRRTKWRRNLAALSSPCLQVTRWPTVSSPGAVSKCTTLLLLLLPAPS